MVQPKLKYILVTTLILFASFTKSHCQNSKWWLLEAEKYFSQNNIEEGCTIIEKLHEAEPNNLKIKTKYCDCLTQQGKANKAINLLLNLSVEPDLQSAYLNSLALANAANNQLIEAKKNYTQLRLKYLSNKKSPYYKTADAWLKAYKDSSFSNQIKTEISSLPFNDLNNANIGITVFKQGLITANFENGITSFRQLNLTDTITNLYEFSNLFNKVASPFYFPKMNAFLFTGYANEISKIYYSTIDSQSLSKPKPLNLENFKNPKQAQLFEFNNNQYLLFSAENKDQNSIYYGQINDDFSLENIRRIELNTNNAITPFYHYGKLYFASNSLEGFGGYDLFICTWFPEVSPSKLHNLGYKVNSVYNELYPMVQPENTEFLMASNRPVNEQSCCNNLYKFESWPWAEPQIKQEISAVKIEQLNLLLPLTIYFDNDQPARGSTITSALYDIEKLNSNYLAKKNIYLKSLKKLSADFVKPVEIFFDDSLSVQTKRLTEILKQIQIILENGEKLNLQIRGYASPLASEEYNRNLSARRIDALSQFLTRWNNGILKKSIENGHLILELLPLGSLNSKFSIENIDYKIFSKEAIKSRKIEIIKVNQQ